MIDLPDSPRPAGASPALIDFGTVLTPPLGGPLQKVDRMGSRFRIAVSMPPMKAPKLGRIWVSRLLRAKLEGARMAFPLQGFDPGLPGSVAVNGSGQAGAALTVDGATPNYTFREGQFFSLVTGGAHHLHFVTAETIANASGQAVLPICPMLRVPPSDNDACHFGKPMIEGFILGDEQAWRIALAQFNQLEFELVEVE